MLSPNDHVKALVELLRMASGQGPDLARRWLAALLIIPEAERAAAVEAVERRVAATYPMAPSGLDRSGSTVPVGAAVASAKDPRDVEFIVVHPAEQREGYVEQIERTFGLAEVKPEAGKRVRRKLS